MHVYCMTYCHSMNNGSYSKWAADKKGNECSADVVLRTNRCLCGTIVTYSLCGEGERKRWREGERNGWGEREGGKRGIKIEGGRERKLVVKHKMHIYACFHT